MINGVLNPLPCNECYLQSFFVDAFSLTESPAGAGAGSTVPEPAAWLLSAVAVAMLSAFTTRPASASPGEFRQLID